ncbi:P-loop containing nucleoside triphosphate hydrolase protein [Pisolithus orientalis]|uniref:P-loop containing nucleoside triphosphate hydrolase protein n=1 Tax=Pisolithus orientalis TaxID=936130 RepID=UPI0022253645|nr:P-loop containing nucleoside triphosphate hydrolase protein [Pisolithus orientalis]KAI5990574.1 P-loop containing nucleoside triphosphate hydrolase protein [Pisolithus orientalis]
MRVKHSMEERLFEAKLSCNLSTPSQTSSAFESSRDPVAVFDCLELSLRLAQSILSTLLQLRLIVHVVNTGFQHAGVTFVLLSLAPVFADSMLINRQLWGKKYVVQPVNESYLRKSALLKLADERLKSEVIAAGIEDYLIREYRKTQENLRDIPDTMPEMLYRSQNPLFSQVLSELCPQAVMLYAAFIALFTPSKISLAQLAVVERTNISLRRTFTELMMWTNPLLETVASVERFYGGLVNKPQMVDGETPYPRPGHDNQKGTAVEFRNVSFNYPAAKTDRSALSSVSFTIQPGQLVIIVGSNGSGKTTILKLLSRFYDVNSGTILIDGVPIQEYRIQDLRRRFAMLTQEHDLFPLSIRENIVLGAPDGADPGMDKPEVIAEIVQESLRLSGAEKTVNKFSEGLNTTLDPRSDGHISFNGRGDAELEKMHESFTQSTSVSGGERQRLVAARTFMRLLSTPVKLVTVDEPSSALDPAGEFQLFAHLRGAREGRTMLFVTHRFGHLTKHADLIICVKDGQVVETGTHVELVALGGEYAHLYNVQAQAFSTETSSQREEMRDVGTTVGIPG